MSLRPTLALCFVVIVPCASTRGAPPQDSGSAWDEAVDGPLPRWREGGTPERPNATLHPQTVPASAVCGPEMPPTSGLIASPPEYAPCDGVLFRYSSSAWPEVVIDCVAALTGSPAHAEKAYVVVASQTVANSAASAFQAAGANLSKVEFLIEPSNSIWLRDYGPHFVWQSGALVIADSHYYPTRPLDNFVPTLVAGDFFIVPPYAMGLYYSGGNFQPGPNRSGFVTNLVNTDNPDLTSQEIADLYHDYQGIDTLHILPRLPSTVDGTGHVDMWMYLVDQDTVVVSQFKAGSNATAIQVTNNAVPYMQALGFDVVRTPAWNSGGTHYTYTNAFRVNDRIFVPTYGQGNASYLADDAAALAAWATAAGPGVQIVPIDCYGIIPAAGAIHCIVKQVPRFTAALPSVHVIAPDGGELLPVLSTFDIRWAASDDLGVTSVDLRYSIDGGLTYPFLIAAAEPDDGQFTWSIPLRSSQSAKVRVTAHDVEGNVVSADSSATFKLLRARTRTYDFGTSAGVDRWAWGYQSSSWTQLDGQRHPAAVATALSAGAYAALASSDATGGDSDANRYIAPTPGSSSESTHVFEFTIQEPVSCLKSLEILWEGYGDDCLQMELYVWDNQAGNWCDAAGRFGLNRYAQNFAGNRDERLSVAIPGSFDRYVDAYGRLTFLLYGERSGQESFHDYVAVKVSRLQCP